MYIQASVCDQFDLLIQLTWELLLH